MVIPETERDERGGIRMTGFRISSSILRAPKDIEKLLKKKQAKASAFEEPDTSNEESPPPAIRPYDFSFLEHGSELSKAQPRGKWRLLKKLGEGGGGIVHLASDRSILDPFIELEVNIPKAVNIGVMQYGDQKFKDSKQLLRIISRMLFPPPGALGALKEPLLERITDKSARERAEERFRREIEVLALPEKHPHLIKMLDHDPGMRWFVMELFEEGTLHENAAAFRGRLRKTLTAILGIVGVLDMLHKRNVIHRDIKPKNIFTSNRTRELVLADFGVVWRRDDDLTRLTEGSEAPGSANWMPNWIKHKQATLEDFTPSCDLYSLGKTIYYCIAGRNVEPSQLPRDDSDLTKLFPGLPGMSPLMEFLKGRVIVDEESACIQSAGEFRTALIEILSATT
jgi:serine/threonine protein kinase